MRIPALRRNDGWSLAIVFLAIGSGTISHLRSEEEVEGTATSAFSPEAVEFFEKRVRPILAESCLECHGEAKQSSELRLDTRQAAIDGGANGPALVPGRPDESLLIQAVRRTHDEIKMPPKARLDGDAIDALTSWVKMGAPWSRGAVPSAVDRDTAGETHWSFRPVRAVAPPAVNDPSWARTPVDAFILARLEREGLRPSPPADRRALIRRASFDLTGLPPTPEEVAAFESDASHDAFARVVDRLLASPRYGERWGRHWLDVARYADTKGYLFQAERRYPYSYTYRDYVIRSFNEDRPYDRFVVEQVAADRLDLGGDRRPLAALGFLTVGRRFLDDNNEIIDDRIDVVGRGLLGLTVSCARCHDHKFDPIPTEDYYSLYGVFSSSPEPDELPVIATSEPNDLTRDFDRQLREREKARDEFLIKKRDEVRDDLRGRFPAYLKAAFDRGFKSGDPGGRGPDDRDRPDVLPAGRLRAFTARWQDHLAATKATHDPIFAPWHSFAALAADNFASRGAELARQMSEPGPGVHPLVARAFAEKPPASMAEVVAQYGALLAEAETRWQALSKSNPAATALDDTDREMLRQVLYSDSGPIAIPTEAIPKLVDRKERNLLRDVEKKIDQLEVTHAGAPPRAMVLNDVPAPADPQVFIRGNPGRRGKSIPRQFLKVLAGPDRKPFAKGSGRLELAGAIATPDNPLTARVMVNRIWLNHFGAGLVATPSDFGLRSDPPSHPELLDYLADRFVREGWSIKAMHRAIMLSNTYQQRSDTRPECAERDPANRLVWKFNRQRLDFESTRDSLLAVSGRLDPSMGGRSVPLTSTPFTARRTVYGFVDRQNLDGVFRTFDFASPDATSARRHVTTVPQQALFLMNSPFVIEQARGLAARSGTAPADADPATRVRQLYRLLFNRAPERHELELSVAFARHASESEDGAVADASTWQYGFGAYDESSGRVGRFEPLPHWTGSAWQFGKELPDPEGGHLFLSAAGGHVGRDAGHAAIRRWVAPRDAVIAIEAVLRHENAKGDGVRGRIVSSRVGELGSWLAQNAKVPTRVDRHEVKQGETIDFVVDCRGDDSFDGFGWSPSIRALDPTPAEWNAKADFRGSPPPTLTAWEKYAQVLLLTNEFAFVD